MQEVVSAEPANENGRSSRSSVNGDVPGRVRSPSLSCSASVFGDDGPQAFTTGKGMRQEGQRNLQDSTFSISGNSWRIMAKSLLEEQGISQFFPKASVQPIGVYNNWIPDWVEWNQLKTVCRLPVPPTTSRQMRKMYIVRTLT